MDRPGVQRPVAAEAAERDFVARYLNDRALLIFRKGSTTAFRSAEDLGGIAATQWTALLEIHAHHPSVEFALPLQAARRYVPGIPRRRRVP